MADLLSIHQIYTTSRDANFRGALRHLTERADSIYVLSAKYGLLPLEQVAAPYDQTLTGATQDERTAWARQVAADLVARHGPSLVGITFEFHTGVAYRHPLETFLAGAGASCTCPVAGLSIGERLGYYATRGQSPVPVPVAAGAHRSCAAGPDLALTVFLSGLRDRELRTGSQRLRLVRAVVRAPLNEEDQL